MNLLFSERVQDEIACMKFDLHKDTISNGRCVVPLRKEYTAKRVSDVSTTQMSSQQVVKAKLQRFDMQVTY